MGADFNRIKKIKKKSRGNNGEYQYQGNNATEISSDIKEDIIEQNNNMNGTVNVFNFSQNDLKLVGYDKNGLPVYSLNNQNFNRETKPNNAKNDLN